MKKSRGEIPGFSYATFLQLAYNFLTTFDNFLTTMLQRSQLNKALHEIIHR